MHLLLFSPAVLLSAGEIRYYFRCIMFSRRKGHRQFRNSQILQTIFFSAAALFFRLDKSSWTQELLPSTLSIVLPRFIIDELYLSKGRYDLEQNMKNTTKYTIWKCPCTLCCSFCSKCYLQKTLSELLKFLNSQWKALILWY